jgi:hypothetical protein
VSNSRLFLGCWQTIEKRQTEERSLISVDDSFRKVIITADKVMKHRDEQGVIIMGLQDFLMNPEASF